MRLGHHIRGPLTAGLSTILLTGVLASAASAQTITIGDTVIVTLQRAEVLALSVNPELLAASWRPEAARGAVRSAGALRFNPEATFESRSPGDGFASRYEAELGLELEVAGQRGLRRSAAEAGLAASYERLGDEARRVLTEVGHGYAALVAAEQRAQLVTDMSDLASRLLAAVRSQLAEGRISRLEANLATIEAARAEARSLAATADRASASLQLARLLGIDPSRPFRSAGPIHRLPADSALAPTNRLVAQAVGARPDLAALDRDIERAREEERLARRAAFPNLRIAALATKENALADPSLGIALGVELPLFNRKQGESDRGFAQLAEAERMRAARELQVRTEVEAAVREYREADAELALLESELLPPIRESRDLLEIAYREGKMDLTSVLLVRNQLLDSELRYWEAWERRERAYTDVESATGEILTGISVTTGRQ